MWLVFKSFLQGVAGFLFFLGFLDVGKIKVFGMVFCFCGVCGGLQ